jgi:DNA-binding MarR family transcriptional regulator
VVLYQRQNMGAHEILMVDEIIDDDALGEGLGLVGQRVAVNLGPLPEFPGYLLRQAHVRVHHGMQPILASFAIRPTQFGVMILLKYNPGIQPSEVAAALGLKRANFVPLLDDLRTRGLAETLPHPDDRRARALYLTKAGQVLMGKLESAVGDYERGVMAMLDPENTGLLAGIVAKLAACQGG